jgi:hypothetical protein
MIIGPAGAVILATRTRTASRQGQAGVDLQKASQNQTI